MRRPTFYIRFRFVDHFNRKEFQSYNRIDSWLEIIASVSIKVIFSYCNETDETIEFNVINFKI